MSNKTYEILIKRNKSQLDEKRRILADLQAQHAQLKASLDALNQKRQDEWQAMNQQPAYQIELSFYMHASLKEAERITKAMQDLQQQIDSALEAVRIAYSEVSKMEIILEEKIKQQQAEMNRKSQIILDEVAMQMSERQNN